MHPETELIPFLRGELAPADHDRVATHVAACEECRRATDERLLATRLTARNVNSATQFCGSAMVKVPTGGMKK